MNFGKYMLAHQNDFYNHGHYVKMSLKCQEENGLDMRSKGAIGIELAFTSLSLGCLYFLNSSKNKKDFFKVAAIYWAVNVVLNFAGFGIATADWYRPMLGEECLPRDVAIASGYYLVKTAFQDIAFPFAIGGFFAELDRGYRASAYVFKKLNSFEFKAAMVSFACAAAIYSVHMGYKIGASSFIEDIKARNIISGLISSIFLIYTFLSWSTPKRLAVMAHESLISKIMQRDDLDNEEKKILTNYLTTNKQIYDKGAEYISAEEIEEKLCILYDEQIAKNIDKVEEEPALKKERRISSIRKMMLVINEKTEIRTTVSSKPAIKDYPDFIESVFKTKQQTNAYYYKKGEIIIDLNSILKSHAKFRADNHDLKKIYSTSSVYEYRFNNGQSDDRALGIRVEGYVSFLNLLDKLSVKYEESEARQVEEFAKRGDNKTSFTAIVFIKMSNHANLTKDANSMQKHFEK